MRKKTCIGTLAAGALAVCLTIGAFPGAHLTVRADWKDLLWEVYDQMDQPADGQYDEEKYDDDDRYEYDEDDRNGYDDEDDDDRYDKSGGGTYDWDEDVLPVNSLEDVPVEEDGSYTSKWEVAAYIHKYDSLPDNFITKKEAQNLGWNSREGNLHKVAPGKSIGGDRFGNYEGQLPEKKGRRYYECDIDYEGGYREEERIIFSDDGLIFYTDNHYQSFEQLWPEEE